MCLEKLRKGTRDRLTPLQQVQNKHTHIANARDGQNSRRIVDFAIIYNIVDIDSHVVNKIK